MSRFTPHPKNPNILVGNTYQIPGYKKPWDCDKAIQEEKARQMEVEAHIVEPETVEV